MSLLEKWKQLPYYKKFALSCGVVAFFLIITIIMTKACPKEDYMECASPSCATVSQDDPGINIYY